VVFDFATSCKKSDEQVIKKEEAVRSFRQKLILMRKFHIADVKERFDRELQITIPILF
jgi:hypothetical protein